MVIGVVKHWDYETMAHIQQLHWPHVHSANWSLIELGYNSFPMIDLSLLDPDLRKLLELVFPVKKLVYYWMCYAISLTNSCPTKLSSKLPQKKISSEIVIFPGLMEGFTKKKLLFFWILSKLQPPHRLSPIWTTCTTSKPLQKRRFKRYSKWLIIQNSS